MFREGHMRAYVAAAILCQQRLPAGATHSSLDVLVIAVGPGLVSSAAALTGVSETMDKQVVVVWE